MARVERGSLVLIVLSSSIVIIMPAAGLGNIVKVAEEPERRRVQWVKRRPDAYWTFQELVEKATQRNWTTTDDEGNSVDNQRYAKMLWETALTKDQDAVQLQKRMAPFIAKLTPVSEAEWHDFFQGKLWSLPGIVLESFPVAANKNPRVGTEEETPTNLSLCVRPDGTVDFRGGVQEWAQVTIEMARAPAADVAPVEPEKKEVSIAEKPNTNAGSLLKKMPQKVRVRTSRSWTQYLRVNEKGVLEGKKGTTEEEGTIFELLWREPSPRFTLAPLGSSQAIGTFVARWCWEENQSDLEAQKLAKEKPEFQGVKCYGQDPRFCTFPQFVRYHLKQRWGGPAKLGALCSAMAMWNESRTPEDCEYDEIIKKEWAMEFALGLSLDDAGKG